MKGLSNKELEWLTKPDDCRKEKRLVHIQSGFAIGTDGYRLHAINLDNMPDTIEEYAIKEKVLEPFEDNVAIEHVYVNPRYLMDALTGMLDEQQSFGKIKLSVAKNPDNNMIAIRLDDDEKTAIIMCFMEDENE